MAQVREGVEVGKWGRPGSHPHPGSFGLQGSSYSTSSGRNKLKCLSRVSTDTAFSKLLFCAPTFLFLFFLSLASGGRGGGLRRGGRAPGRERRPRTAHLPHGPGRPQRRRRRREGPPRGWCCKPRGQLTHAGGHVWERNRPPEHENPHFLRLLEYTSVDGPF